MKATCVGEGGRPKPIGCIVETLADYRSILPPRLFGDVPVVYLDPSRPLNWRGAAVVACDNAAVAAAAYDELSAGMPQCYAAVPSCSAFPWNRERIDAFRVLCAADGRELRVFPARRREPKERRVARLAKWLAVLPSRSAVFAANDTVAKDIAEAASAIPRHIPRELTVIRRQATRTPPRTGRIGGLAQPRRWKSSSGTTAARGACGAYSQIASSYGAASSSPASTSAPTGRFPFRRPHDLDSPHSADLRRRVRRPFRLARRSASIESSPRRAAASRRTARKPCRPKLSESSGTAECPFPRPTARSDGPRATSRKKTGRSGSRRYP